MGKDPQADRVSQPALGVPEDVMDHASIDTKIDHSQFKRVPTRGEQIAKTIQRPSISYWQDASMRLKANRTAISAGIYIILLAISAVLIPELLPFSYDEQEIWNKHATPTFAGIEAVVVDGAPAYENLLLSPAADGSDDNSSDTTDSFDVEPPTSPEELKVIGEPLTSGVVLNWSPVPGVDGYRVYRSIAADTLGLPLADLDADELSYLDRSSLQIGETYFYFVAAFNMFGDSEDPPFVEVQPKLALDIADARKFKEEAQVGDVITTTPHYLGTDYLGRDLLARVMIGARISLFIGFGAPLLYILIGIIYGSISGYFGGLVDDLMMRITDTVATVPELLVVILLQVVMGSGVVTLLIAMVAVAWARSARQIRGEVLRLREMEFVHAAKVLGTSFPKTVARHLLPNVMGTVLVVLTLAVPQAIFTEAFLSFIGLGIAPPMASWGTVTKEGARVFLTYPHELVIPSVLISVTMLAFNLFGDGLRDALDPKLRGVR